MMNAVGADRLTLVYARMASGGRAINLSCRLNGFAALGTLHLALLVLPIRRRISEASGPTRGDGACADALATTIPKVALT
ncbi:hypothetical protein WME94_50490 [Sorangium sp. So ce429]